MIEDFEDEVTPPELGEADYEERRQMGFGDSILPSEPPVTDEVPW